MAEVRSRARVQMYAGLAFALAVVMCGTLLVALEAPQPLRAVAAGGVVLWAPGFALSTIVFIPGSIGGVERALLAVVGSLSLTVLAAILLDFLGVRLGTGSFLMAADVVTGLSAALALWRLQRLVNVPTRAPGWRSPLVPTAIVVSTGLVLTGALIAARVTPRPVGIQGSSVLAVTNSGPRSIEAQVICAELTATTYRLAVLTSTGLVASTSFRLAPGSSWRRRIRRPVSSDAVQMLLYRGVERRPYRRVVVPSAST